MATKQEIIDALRQVNERLDGLKERILAGPDAHLPTGTWTVRDAMCHLAARSNGVPNFITRVERAAQVAAGGSGAAAPPLPNIDDINQSQIDARAGHSIQELYDEASQGHLTAIEEIGKLDDAIFDRDLPNARDPGTVAQAGETLLRSTANHDNTHLNEIEQALGG